MIEQTSSKCIQNARANAGRLLDVCWKLEIPAENRMLKQNLDNADSHVS